MSICSMTNTDLTCNKLLINFSAVWQQQTWSLFSLWLLAHHLLEDHRPVSPQDSVGHSGGVSVLCLWCPSLPWWRSTKHSGTSSLKKKTWKSLSAIDITVIIVDVTHFDLICRWYHSGTRYCSSVLLIMHWFKDGRDYGRRNWEPLWCCHHVGVYSQSYNVFSFNMTVFDSCVLLRTLVLLVKTNL